MIGALMRCSDILYEIANMDLSADMAGSALNKKACNLHAHQVRWLYNSGLPNSEQIIQTYHGFYNWAKEIQWHFERRYIRYKGL